MIRLETWRTAHQPRVLSIVLIAHPLFFSRFFSAVGCCVRVQAREVLLSDDKRPKYDFLLNFGFKVFDAALYEDVRKDYDNGVEIRGGWGADAGQRKSPQNTKGFKPRRMRCDVRWSLFRATDFSVFFLSSVCCVCCRLQPGL